MPFFTIYSNAYLDKEQEQKLLTKSLDLLSEKLSKPKDFFAINYIYNPSSLYGSSFNNIGALAELKSIGFPQNMNDLAMELADILRSTLKADPSFINIEFVNLPRSSVSIAGKLL